MPCSAKGEEEERAFLTIGCSLVLDLVLGALCEDLVTIYLALSVPRLVAMVISFAILGSCANVIMAYVGRNSK